MTIFQLNLAKHTSNPAILSSLAWNAVRDELNMLGREDLTETIESIKITPTRITIRTGKPIVNQELSHHRESIRTRIEKAFETFGIKKVERKIVLI